MSLNNIHLDSQQFDLYGEHKVLDKGFVRVVGLFGDDASIVQAARVSYGKGTKSVLDDEKLIRYLMKHRHTSPFEMCEIKLHVKLPIFVTRQWIRHRTANVNEYSARYSEMHNEFYYPSHEMMRTQSLLNKQGSDEQISFELYNKHIQEMEKLCASAYKVYEEMLADGVARETARGILPINIYTQMYWKIDLHNLLHFLRLRLPKNAQQEIREYAQVINVILQHWMPITHRAFTDYGLNSFTYSGAEQELLRQSLDKNKALELIQDSTELSAREKAEMRSRLDLARV